jgi:prephenate dehydratase
VSAARADELAFLGPRGTYSEQAAELYRSRVKTIDRTAPLPTITGVIDAVKGGTVARGLIPVVTTSSGFPLETSRLLSAAIDPGFRVVGEVNIPIDNDLMAKPDATIATIRTVLSHPNALGEARDWLRAHLPDAQLQETRSTAAAAEQVSHGDTSMAAVAGPAAAKLFGLTLLAERIQDNKDNRTSFWVIEKAQTKLAEEHPDRVVINLDAPAGSRVFSTVVAGALRVGFSVLHVNSAPLPGKLFGYRYTITLAAERPVLLLRVTDNLARDVRAGGDGKGMVIGAWRSNDS